MAIDNDEPTIGETPQRRRGPHAPLPTSGLGQAALEPPLPATTQAREEDPRTRAARRALELREHWGGDHQQEGEDKFYIDPRMVPPGWSYEWKMHTVLNAESPAYQVQIANAGWETVPAYRHPELMPDTYKGMTIDRDGMRLMERPAEITEAAKARELRKARDQVGQKEAQLHGAPAGANSPFATDNKGSPLVKLGKSYEAMKIPRE
jgi:hypothetical protein